MKSKFHMEHPLEESMSKRSHDTMVKLFIKFFFRTKVQWLFALLFSIEGAGTTKDIRLILTNSTTHVKYDSECIYIYALNLTKMIFDNR